MSVKINRVSRNPLDLALDLLGMSRVEFQVEGGYSKPYLLRLSQGRQSHMGERVLSDLYRLAGAKGIDLDALVSEQFPPAADVSSSYQLWIIKHRKAQIMPEPVKDASLNPFMRLVAAVGSVSRMSALLAAPDQLVERYAKGVSYVMPMPVMSALTDMDYPHTAQLEAAMRKWGEDHA